MITLKRALAVLMIFICVILVLNYGFYITDKQFYKKYKFVNSFFHGGDLASSPLPKKDLIYKIEDFGGRAGDKNFDNSGALERAIRKLNRTNSIIVLGTGVYEFKTAIKIDYEVEGVKITGISVGELHGNGTVINWSGKGYLFTSLSSIKECMISTLRINCKNNSSFNFKQLSECKLSDISIANSIEGIRIKNYNNIILENISINTKQEKAKYALHIGDKDSNSISNGVLIANSSFDGGDIANCDALKISSGSNIVIENTDICNWLSGRAINLEKSRFSNKSIYFSGINVARCDGGIVIDNNNRQKLFIINLSLIFRGKSSDEKGIVVLNNISDNFEFVVTDLHTRKIDNMSPRFIIESLNQLTDNVHIDISQNLAKGVIDTKILSSSTYSKSKLLDIKDSVKLHMINTLSSLNINLFFSDSINSKDIRGIYRIEDFGGRANDKNFNNSIALEKALDDLVKKGGVLLFSEGEYTFKTPVVIKTRIRGVHFIGVNQSSINWAGKATLLTFEKNLWWCKFQNLVINCNNNNFISFQGVLYKSYLTNLTVKGCRNAINIEGCAYSFINNVNIYASKDIKSNLISIGQNNKKSVEFLYLDNCYIIGNNSEKSIGLNVNSGAHVYISNCKIDNFTNGCAVCFNRRPKDRILLMIYLDDITISNCNIGIHFFAEQFIGIIIIDNPTVIFGGSNESDIGFNLTNKNNKTVELTITNYCTDIRGKLQPDSIFKVNNVNTLGVNTSISLGMLKTKGIKEEGLINYIDD